MSGEAPKAMTATQAGQIISGWASGQKYEEACIQAGLTPAEARALKKDGDWLNAYNEARAMFVAGSLENIRKHSEGDWKASAWLLERLMPDRFGRRDVLDVNVKSAPMPWKAIVSGEVIEVKAEVKDADDKEDKDA